MATAIMTRHVAMYFSMKGKNSFINDLKYGVPETSDKWDAIYSAVM